MILWVYIQNTENKNNGPKVNSDNCLLTVPNCTVKVPSYSNYLDELQKAGKYLIRWSL